MSKRDIKIERVGVSVCVCREREGGKRERECVCVVGKQRGKKRERVCMCV